MHWGQTSIVRKKRTTGLPSILLSRTSTYKWLGEGGREGGREEWREGGKVEGGGREGGREQTCQVSHILRDSHASMRLALDVCPQFSTEVAKAEVKSTLYSLLYTLGISCMYLIASFPKENLRTRLECLLVLFPGYDY